jgi:hypothetical protein
MNATTYTGTGSSVAIANGVSGQAFQPDFVWIKSRSNTTQNCLYDVIRGPRVELLSNSTSAEVTEPAGSSLTAFNTNGFQLGTDNATAGSTNNSGYTYVGWQWKAGGTAVTNTSGTISSQVSANTTSGFSIATFTAPSSGNFTVGHGLGVAPAMFILKTRSGTDGWYVYHKNLGTPASNYLVLNTTAATASSTSVWGNTAPTSSVITLGTNAGIAANATGLLYSWAEIAGFSKFGSYTGNGSTDGTFVYTGFRPKFVIFKASSTGGTNYDWFIEDSTRSPSNQVGLYLVANLADAETSNPNFMDFLSNGFKMRSSSTYFNGSGSTYIYAAFAENPFKYANAR